MKRIAEQRNTLAPGLIVTALLVIGGVRCAQPPPRASAVPPAILPNEPFTHRPLKPFDPHASYFTFDQLDHYYRVPGEFTHRLTGDQYGFQSLSFIITETHPGGGPGLHVHDVEEAHVLLEGTAEYVVGDQRFTVQAPYVAKVPPQVPHTFINAGGKVFNLIAVFASNHPTSTRVGPNPLIAAGSREKEKTESGFIP
ncbi:MAG: cupin domain-containing protein [Thermoanaerobaculia bacterium]